jgi:RNA polymerase sigma-B factor
MTDASAARDAEHPEVLALFERAADDPGAREDLVLRYRSFAEYLARRFVGRGEPLDDLIQVANLGLLNAIDRFDPERGVLFATYAAATIVGELKRHFRDKGWAIRVPRRLQEIALRLNAAVPELTQQLGRAPTIRELSKNLEASDEEIVEALDAVHAYSTTSLEAPTSEGGLTPLDALGGEDPTLAIVDEWAAIAPAVVELPERERRVLYLRFFEGKTQSEIAAEIGVSQMHVSRLLTQTIDRLRATASVERDTQA